jgi:hypothetical protein
MNKAITGNLNTSDEWLTSIYIILFASNLSRTKRNKAITGKFEYIGRGASAHLVEDLCRSERGMEPAVRPNLQQQIKQSEMRMQLKLKK